MTTEDAILLGHFHFPLTNAALCVETDVQQGTHPVIDTPVPCEHVFDMTFARDSSGAIRCPACGGAHWIMLAEALNRRGSYRDVIDKAIMVLGDLT